jgi:hypothetical protein
MLGGPAERLGSNSRHRCYAMMETRKERGMKKSILVASPAFVVAGALLAGTASAQTLTPSWNQPAAQPYGGQATPQQQIGQATLPRGPYLATCKEARMLEDTLTAFCSKGDGTWQTTQLWHVGECTGGVQNAGGDLVCAMAPQVGSSTPPQSYGSSYGTSYGMTAPPVTGAYAPTYAPAAAPAYPPTPGQAYAPVPVYPPAPVPAYPSASVPTYPPAPGQTYAPQTYNGYAAGVPSSDEYSSSSASKTARPYGY